MSPATRPPCPHDLGPGTTVCLRCRQEERQLALARQRRMLMRVGLTLAGVVVVAVIGNAVMRAVRTSASTRGRAPLQLLASTSTTSSVQQQGTPAASSAASASPVTPAPAAKTAPVLVAAPAIPAAPRATPASTLTLKVPFGRSGLRDSMYVERDADSAVVHFDTELARTRRRDKFVLYGAGIDSMLAALPDGAITGDRDLVNEAAVRGVRLPVPTGGTLELWPVTRPGRDGPLVVGYRARITP